MGVEGAEGFLATGGSIRIGFECEARGGGTDLDWGAIMRGREVGLYSQARDPGPISGTPLDGNVPPQVAVIGTSRDGPGVVGASFGTFGVFGQLGDPGPALDFAKTAGVIGTSASSPGVVGTSSGDIGVIGSSVDEAGVFGQSRNQTGVGGTSDNNIGVVGTSLNSFGVFGQSGRNAAVRSKRAAILGTSSKEIAVGAFSDTNTAVYAQSGPEIHRPFRLGAVTALSTVNTRHAVSAVSSQTEAVRGVSFGSHGITGHSSANYGVYGLSFAPPRAPGVKLADAPAGVYGQSITGSIGVLGVADGTGAGIVGIGTGNALAGFFQGNLTVTGQIFAGIKDAIVPFPDGSRRLLHCMESPEHWFEDFGAARLKRGRAVAKLDADFAKTIRTGDYRVFLTPEGDCGGLYIKSKRGGGFEVRELQGGRSNVAFSYRIVGRRRDIKGHKRFARIDITPPMRITAPRTVGRTAARAQALARKLRAAMEKHVAALRAKPARGRKVRSGRQRKARA